MAKIKGIMTKTYLCFIVLLVLLTVLIYVSVYEQTHMPNIAELKPMDTTTSFFTFKTLVNMGNKVSAYSEVDDAVINNDPMNKNNAKVVLTNDMFGEQYNLQMVGGCYFSRDMVKDKEHCAVISDQLAEALYPMENGVSQNININGFEYYIVGVYESDMAYWPMLSKDDADRVFVPYTTWPDHDHIKLDALAFPVSERVHGVIDSLRIDYPLYLMNTKINHYNEKMAYSTQFTKIFITILQLLIIVYTVIIVYKIVREYVENLVANKHEYYWGKLLVHNKLSLSVCLASMVVGAGLLVLVLRSIDLTVVMSNWLLPQDNLFEPSHYLSKIQAFFIQNNSLKQIGNGYLNRLVNKTLLVSILCLLWMLPCLVLYLRKYKSMIKVSRVYGLELLGYTLLLLVICTLLKPMAVAYMSVAISVLLHLGLLLVVYFIHSVHEFWIHGLLVTNE